MEIVLEVKKTVLNIYFSKGDEGMQLNNAIVLC